MKIRTLILSLVAVVALATGWYAFRPERLWVNQAVHEDLASASAMTASSEKSSEMSSPSESSMSGMSAATETRSPALVASGMFHNGAHETKGTASVYTLANGSRVLRLTGFETSNGPDVHVLLVAARDAQDNATVTKAGFVDVASLKGNIGDQNYELPRELDLSRYGAVTIWCKRFGVNFGTAPLANHS